MQQSVKLGGSFYRGDIVNKAGREADFLACTGIQEFVLKGWMPERPFIGPKTNIVAFGSCFAANIGRYLAGLGFDIATAREGKTHVQAVSDGLVNVHAICQQFEWAWENRTPSVSLWHGWKAEDYGYDEMVRLETKKLFDAADVFVLTFGLSEVWYDEPTGEVFWRAVPADKFDASRHKFRVATSAETSERLRRIYDLIRKHRPHATIIFTLSPVPLSATFRPVSCTTSNSVSKAILRAAIDELYRAVSDDRNFFYFPSYEVVMHAFQTPFGTDRRHPLVHVIAANMKAFERYFCETGMTDEVLQAEIKSALDLDETLTKGNRREGRMQVRARKAALISASAKPTSVEKELRRQQKKDRRQQEKGSLGASDKPTSLEKDLRRQQKRDRLQQQPVGDREARLARRALRLQQRAAKLSSGTSADAI